MPFNVQRSAQFSDKEVLKFPAGLDAIKSVVLDSSNWAYVADTRNIIPAGTILMLSATNADKYVAFDGTGGANVIKGILGHSVDFIASTTSAAEPAPMFYHQCVFATSALVAFTNYASALVSTLTTCKFE